MTKINHPDIEHYYRGNKEHEKYFKDLPSQLSNFTVVNLRGLNYYVSYMDGETKKTFTITATNDPPEGMRSGCSLYLIACPVDKATYVQGVTTHNTTEIVRNFVATCIRMSYGVSDGRKNTDVTKLFTSSGLSSEPEEKRAKRYLYAMLGDSSVYIKERENKVQLRFYGSNKLVDTIMFNWVNEESGLKLICNHPNFNYYFHPASRDLEAINYLRYAYLCVYGRKASGRTWDGFIGRQSDFIFKDENKQG